MFFKKTAYLVILVMIISSVNLLATQQIDSKYIVRTFIDQDGNSIDEIIVPGRPPVDHREPAVELPDPSVSDAINILSNVPAFDWSYGCSATSAAMMAGYYDNLIHPEMYTGSTNGGIVPMNNSVWGSGECPVSATHQGFDGLSSKGHVDDYWISYGSSANDPYITGGWTAHSNADCTGDYMGTNQSALANTDGATTFYSYTSGAILYDYTACEPAQKDGTHGLRQFFESRGYAIQNNGGNYQNYSQYILGQGSNPSLGFTYAQFIAEIDAGRPVLIQVEGHTMLGFGYDDSSNLVYIHDTWDHNNHTMTWGGVYYNGTTPMQHYGVGVFILEDPTITTTAPNGGEDWDIGTNHNITWSSQYVSNIDIDLYLLGTYVMTIVGNYPASSGSYPWYIPTSLAPSSNYSIRISDSDASANNDDSNAYFSLSNSSTPLPIIDVDPNTLVATVELNDSDTQLMQISNTGEAGSTLNYTLSHSFTDSDNITGSYVVCSPSSYTPGETTNWTLSVYNASTDLEWLTDVYVTFPTGVTVNSGTNFTGGNSPLTYDGSTGNGTTVHWYDADGNSFGNIYGGQTATAIVNVTISSAYSGHMTLGYQIDGDTWGSAPHTITGSMMMLHETWLSYTPTTGSCAQNVTDDIDVTMDAAGLPVGIYTADILITNNGGGPVTVPCTLTVIFSPDIEVSPSSLSENLYTNESSTHGLTLDNIGGEQLDSLCAKMTLDTFLH
ncbi:MAG: Ser-Thr-rich GPI-anchored membrane family protein [Candidatus Tenebribacter davisii]|nr:Ser-Thr-rich GPI-anchored membrane family protein [Candidatus Tenebribacter davisii]